MVRSPGKCCNSLHILPSRAPRKPKRIAEPSISFVFSYTGYSNSRDALRASGICRLPASGVTSYHALVEHGISDFYESGDVRANYEIAGLSVIFRGLPGVFEDGGHDVAQSRIDLLPWPRQTHGVLAHLETRGSNASRIRSFAGAKQNFLLQEQIDSRGDARHVGRFGHKIATVIDQFLGVF